nr:ER-derived vesicles protein ERV14 [Cryptomonas curvata]
MIINHFSIKREYVKTLKQNFLKLLFNNKNKKIVLNGLFLYQREGFIDIGTYGKVFKIKKIKNKKTYACKEIQIICRSNFFCISLLKEINFLLAVNHPNIIFIKEAIFDVSFDKIFIVTEYCEYDLKTILESRVIFSPFQIKFIVRQILLGVSILHENKIIHRDIKTSNILLNDKGIIKICDFGLSRSFEIKKKIMTQGVVTLWYRAPEVLVGLKSYTTAIDIWSIGCVFAELVLNDVLIQGKSELDQLCKIFNLLGTPNLDLWKNFSFLCEVQNIKFPIQPFNNLNKKLKHRLSHLGIDLLNRLFSYDPLKRISAKGALKHSYFFS